MPLRSQSLAGLPEQFDQLSMDYPKRPPWLGPGPTHVHLPGSRSRDHPKWSFDFVSLSTKQIAPYPPSPVPVHWDDSSWENWHCAAARISRPMQPGIAGVNHWGYQDPTLPLASQPSDCLQLTKSPLAGPLTPARGGCNTGGCHLRPHSLYRPCSLHC